MTNIALKVDSLSKAYTHDVVLDGISFVIHEGESVGLVGINGAGKSTLIKSILDFISIQSGQIEIFDTPYRQTEARQQLSFLPEKFLPPHYLTGENFLAYMAEMHKVPLLDADIQHVFSVLDLDLSALNKPVRQYSKGMAQKLGLAACFLSQRSLLLLDEPMSGLDPKARANLKAYLLTLKSQGKTIFFSTHLLNDVDSLCDRIIVLHDGRIRFDGSPTACCDKFKAESLEAAYMACIDEPVMA